MKKILLFLLILAVVFAAAGCTEPVTRDSATIVKTESTAEQVSPTEGVSAPTEEMAPPDIEPEDDDFVRILDYIPQARQALPYATADNFTGQVIYPFTDAYLRYGTTKKLVAVAQELEEQGLGLLIWDGYRPVYAQAKLFEACPDPTYVSPPGVGNQNHCRGRAVDLTLVDLKTGERLEMPTDFDDFTAYADRDYRDVSETAAANARILEEVMTKHGFKGYSKEWWHYNDTDSYPIEEQFNPAAID